MLLPEAYVRFMLQNYHQSMDYDYDDPCTVCSYGYLVLSNDESVPVVVPGVSAAKRSATTSSAASQVAGSKSFGNDPGALAVPGLRIHGRSTRSGLCTRSAKRRTLPQIAPPVSGLRASPSTAVTVAPWTVTSKLQVSGQSSGQAVVCVDMPRSYARRASLPIVSARREGSGNDRTATRQP